jgi:hypothetical protein
MSFITSHGLLVAPLSNNFVNISAWYWLTMVKQILWPDASSSIHPWSLRIIHFCYLHCNVQYMCSVIIHNWTLKSQTFFLEISVCLDLEIQEFEICNHFDDLNTHVNNTLILIFTILGFTRWRDKCWRVVMRCCACNSRINTLSRASRELMQLKSVDVVVKT